MAEKNTQIVRMKKNNQKFELVTHGGKVTSYRKDACGWGDVLVFDNAFLDVSKGDKAADALLTASFPDLDSISAIMKHIVINGELEKTQAERSAEMEEKTNAIMYYINQNYADPTTKRPHPMVRLEEAFNVKSNKVRVDLNIDTARQAEQIVKNLRGYLMFTQVVAQTGTLTLASTNASKCAGKIKKFKPTKTDWNTDGSATYHFGMSQTKWDELIETLQKPTSGDFQIHMDHGGVAPAEDVKAKKRGKGKKKRGKR